MLRLIPDTPVSVIERCSGHGGSWGVMKGNFETALKVGRPVARQALRDPKPHLASECPLAGMHILQGMETAGARTSRCRPARCTRSSWSRAPTASPPAPRRATKPLRGLP